ncbi:XRE family transcriptional regulator [Rummeliibacillus sp. TYF005]|uniref:helix-turn-helix domain-containing protein n=1 Tax=Rummeliibacillus sp. TYF005 TaxID=2058214 RepID=UPI000F534EB8|nr:helix-turn-helix transcriptional regulator [Rummeliibacillus sp. TYF005]RPJ97238.1 XRE family transcriptional regulator [Rummeliibacillus sp. TYF005]
MTTDKIQNVILTKRKELGWTREQLGEKLGVSPSYIWRLERGDRNNPSTKILMGLCALFNISPNEITDVDNSHIMDKRKIEEYNQLKEFILEIDVDKIKKLQDLLKSK